MSKRIMIVDDEQDFSMFLRRKLERQGYEVQELSRGAEVVNLLLEDKVDLLLLDYSLPDIPGDELIRMIRETEALKKLPVIIVTAHHNIDQATFAENGADIIYKPVDDDALMAKIESLIGTG